MYVGHDPDKRPKLVVAKQYGIILQNKGSLDRNKLTAITYINVPIRLFRSFPGTRFSVVR